MAGKNGADERGPRGLTGTGSNGLPCIVATYFPFRGVELPTLAVGGFGVKLTAAAAAAAWAVLDFAEPNTSKDRRCPTTDSLAMTRVRSFASLSLLKTLIFGRIV